MKQPTNLRNIRNKLAMKDNSVLELAKDLKELKDREQK